MSNAKNIANYPEVLNQIEMGSSGEILRKSVL